ncbi:DNA primase [Paenibacillus cymbidii]|uniref:DNA primase n=1 Tax=Paenibacillus cymbidii TaxID=1639034 RepID=UPI001081A090|nr:DNA primase [Paenibacillus cymbidii]
MKHGRIPDEVIEAVLKAHDIVDTVGKYVHLTKSGHYMKGLCPFHSEKSPSFTVTPEKQIYYCYGCHAGGNAIHFLMEIEGYHFGEAVRHMAEEAGIAVDLEAASPEQTEQQRTANKLLEAYELSAKWYHYVLRNTEQGKAAMQYLRTRGVNDKMIDAFQIGYAPPMWEKLAQFMEKREMPLALLEQGGLLSARSDGGYFDKFRDRIMFPIHDWKGRVVAFGGRAMGDVQPKYLNSPESPIFNKSRLLYNFHRARASIRKAQHAVLFEGYVDVVQTWEAGVSNGVATMGTALTEQHAEVLRRNAEHITVCYDGDNAGQAAAYKSIAILEQAGMHVKLAVLPAGMDPDDYVKTYGGERFRSEVLQEAIPAVQFRLLYAKRNFQLQDVDDRLRYIDTAVKIIGQLASPVDRDHYIRELAAEFSMTAEPIRQQMNEFRQQHLKKRSVGDNKPNSWNNVMNNEGTSEAMPTVHYPAYHKAERMLLAAMMHDREVAQEVEKQIGDAFNVEAHAALAAYLYAYYAHGYEPDASKYIATLHDEKLERAASSILMLETSEAVNNQAIGDCIREIRKQSHPLQQEIKRKNEERVRAERSGEVILAAQIAIEIITLEKQLKSI